jgi:hypothetical protein
MRTNIEINADGTTLRGWLYVPDEGKGPFPAVVMSPGFALVKESLVEVAEVFVRAGLACVVYDNRCLGESEGEPRQDVDPWAQMRDYRHAITYAQSAPQIDADRIGLWGSSYSGQHALVVAAVDRRVKCVVVQVPGISGFNQAQLIMAPEVLASLREQCDCDRAESLGGAPPATIQMVAEDSSTPTAFPGMRTYSYYAGLCDKVPSMCNEITLRSLDWWLEYDVTQYMKRISPTPLLMIVASDDQISPTDLQLEAFKLVQEPKKLVIIPGDHFSAYLEEFEQFTSAATAWFSEHLQQSRSRTLSAP